MPLWSHCASCTSTGNSTLCCVRAEPQQWHDNTYSKSFVQFCTCPCQFSIWTQAVEEHKILIQVSIFLSLLYSNDSGHMLCLFSPSIFWYPEVTAFQKGHLTLCLYEVLGSDAMKISRKEEDCTLRLVAAAAAYISVLYRGQVSWTWFQQDSFHPSSSSP